MPTDTQEYANLRLAWVQIVPAGAACDQVGCGNAADYTLLASWRGQQAVHLCELHAHELMNDLTAAFGEQIKVIDTYIDVPPEPMEAAS